MRLFFLNIIINLFFWFNCSFCYFLHVLMHDGLNMKSLFTNSFSCPYFIAKSGIKMATNLFFFFFEKKTMSLHVCHGAILSTDFEECSSALSFPGSLITFHLYSFIWHIIFRAISSEAKNSTVGRPLYFIRNRNIIKSLEYCSSALTYNKDM